MAISRFSGGVRAMSPMVGGLTLTTNAVAVSTQTAVSGLVVGCRAADAERHFLLRWATKPSNSSMVSGSCRGEFRTPAACSSATTHSSVRRSLAAMSPIRVLVMNSPRCFLVTPSECEGLPRPQLVTLRPMAIDCHDGKCEPPSTHPEGEVMAILYVGIDLAKSPAAVVPPQ